MTVRIFFAGPSQADFFNSFSISESILLIRIPRRAANEVRVGNQSQDRGADWSYDSADSAHAGGEGDQVMKENQAAMPD
jgi:hypothetical protein